VKDGRYCRFRTHAAVVICAMRCISALAAAAVFVWVVGMVQPSLAQMVSGGKAGSYSTSSGESTWFSYKFGYRQNLLGNWSGSLDYLNEGHFVAHHRDGYALELSYEFQALARYRTWIYAGVGPYYYFDTEPSGAASSIDAHGLAPALTLSARHWISDNFDLVVSLDTVLPTHSPHAQTLTVGLSHWLGKESANARTAARIAASKTSISDSTSDKPTEPVPVSISLARSEPPGFFEDPYKIEEVDASEVNIMAPTPQQLDPDEWAVYGALSVINIVGNPKSDGASVEYRLRLQTGHQRHYDLSFAYLYEGDSRVARRNGVTAQVWPVRSDSTWPVEFAAGFGAYVFIDKRNQPIPSQNPSAAVAPVVSMMISSRPSPRGWFVRCIWDRVVSNNNRDADVWRLGVGSTL